jgi:membrane associated rhomboid family serine protease
VNTAAVLAVLAAILFAVLWVAIAPVVISFRYARADRRRLMANGTRDQAVVTRIRPRGKDECTVEFTRTMAGDTRRAEFRQRATLAAVRFAQIVEGATVEIRFLPRWPAQAFIPTLARAQCIAAGAPREPGSRNWEIPDVYFIAYTAPTRAARTRKPANGYGWTGSGELVLTERELRFMAAKPRPFWTPKPIEKTVALDRIENVEVHGNAVRLEVLESGAARRPVQFWTVDAAEAQAIAARLPAKRTESFAPQIAERAEFAAQLLAVTPHAPVTPTIVALNVVMFVIACVMGAGLFAEHPDVLVRLGSDYTPLTASGEWWRLLTNTFLHFGVLHLAFNMLALSTNGLLAERIFGSARFALIYLASALSGSVASFLWHPLVNGAGASGAIFGVLGALLAFFLVSRGGVPASVLVVQRNAAAVFIIYSLLNGVRTRAIDNAAHLGGLAAGFLLGLLLTRPLDAGRDDKSGLRQWLAAGALVAILSTLVAYGLAHGDLHPRRGNQPSTARTEARSVPPAPAPARAMRVASFAGLHLGMSASELLRLRGEPRRRQDKTNWMYTPVDRSIDAVVDVYFSKDAAGEPNVIVSIMYSGERKAAPPELPYLVGLSAQELAQRYGQRTGETNSEPGFSYGYYAGGIVAWMERGRAIGYGIYQPP